MLYPREHANTFIHKVKDQIFIGKVLVTLDANGMQGKLDCINIKVVTFSITSYSS